MQLMLGSRVLAAFSSRGSDIDRTPQAASPDFPGLRVTVARLRMRVVGLHASAAPAASMVARRFVVDGESTINYSHLLRTNETRLRDPGGTQTGTDVVGVLAVIAWFRSLAFIAALIWFTAPLSAAVIDRATALPAAIIIDARDGSVIAESDADEPRIPASLVKMMTLYLVFEALDTGKLALGQKLKVSTDAAEQEPTKLGLLPNQTITTKDAILGVVTRSANDAAVVLAEALGGSEERFTRLMNAKARQLGMERSLYRNASGLPEPLQSTTARDISILARALLSDYPHHYHYFSTEQFRFRNRLFVNHNKLLGSYPGVDGIKTGYTRASGFNIAVSTERDGRRLIAVVLGGNSARSRDEQTRTLLDGVIGITAPPTVVAAAAPVPVRTAAVQAKSARTVKTDDRPGHAVALAAARTYTPPAAAGGGWSVQVGAFRRQVSAEKEASRVFDAIPALRGARVAIETVSEKGKALFRARLVGFTEDTARDACSTLKRKQFVCVPIRPDGRTE